MEPLQRNDFQEKNKYIISFKSTRSLSPDSAIPYFKLHDCNTFAQVWQSDLRSVFASNPDLETNCSFVPLSLELQKKNTHIFLHCSLSAPCIPPASNCSESLNIMAPVLGTVIHVPTPKVPRQRRYSISSLGRQNKHIRSVDVDVD